MTNNETNKQCRLVCAELYTISHFHAVAMTKLDFIPLLETVPCTYTYTCHRMQPVYILKNVVVCTYISILTFIGLR